MVILIGVVALPFLYWAWWGITLTAIDYAIYLGWQEQENDMKDQFEVEQEHPARLIRYTTLADAEHPNLLSAYDKTKNLQMIDRNLADQLPVAMRQRLETSVMPATMIVDDGMGLRFGEYRQT